MSADAAGGKSDDNAHRPRRIDLRPCEPRHGRERGSARGQMQKLLGGEVSSRYLLSRRLIRSPRRRGRATPRGTCEAERFGGLYIDDELELGRSASPVGRPVSRP